MKAFDTVPHKRLIGKLKSYGIEYYTLRWIQAFLSDRVQQVNVNSEWANITSVNSFKNHLDRHWSTEEFLYNYKAALPGSLRAFQGKVEDLTTEATVYGQEEPK